MRQAMAKGTRRELRRAFGPEVLDTVEAQGVTLEHLVKLVHVLRADLSAIARDHALLKKDTLGKFDVAHDSINSAHDQLNDLRFGGFLRRLRWLVAGQ